jgi:YD repeat-containing protein
MRFWIWLILSLPCTLLFSEENEEIFPSSSEQIAGFSLDTNTLVSPLTGQLSIAETDHINSIGVERTPDSFGNILLENFSTGLSLKKTYDRFNRPLTLELGTGDSIRYTYDPKHLRQIERFSSSGELLYTHVYEEYDLAGNIIQENLIEIMKVQMVIKPDLMLTEHGSGNNNERYY